MSDDEDFEDYEDDDSREGALARRSDPFTSHAAAANVDTRKSERRVIIGFIEGGSANSYSMALRLRRRDNQVSPRFAPLKRRGIIYPLYVEKSPYSEDNVIVYQLNRSHPEVQRIIKELADGLISAANPGPIRPPKQARKRDNRPKGGTEPDLAKHPLGE